MLPSDNQRTNRPTEDRPHPPPRSSLDHDVTLATTNPVCLSKRELLSFRRGRNLSSLSPSPSSSPVWVGGSFSRRGADNVQQTAVEEKPEAPFGYSASLSGSLGYSQHVRRGTCCFTFRGVLWEFFIKRMNYLCQYKVSNASGSMCC